MKFTVPAEYDGISVKQFLRKHCLVSARTLAKLKRTENGMTVNGKTVRSIDMLNGGEEIILTFPEDDIHIEASPLHTEVVYEDRNACTSCSRVQDKYACKFCGLPYEANGGKLFIQTCKPA